MSKSIYFLLFVFLFFFYMNAFCLFPCGEIRQQRVKNKWKGHSILLLPCRDKLINGSLRWSFFVHFAVVLNGLQFSTEISSVCNALQPLLESLNLHKRTLRLFCCSVHETLFRYYFSLKMYILKLFFPPSVFRPFTRWFPLWWRCLRTNPHLRNAQIRFSGRWTQIEMVRLPYYLFLLFPFINVSKGCSCSTLQFSNSLSTILIHTQREYV